LQVLLALLDQPLRVALHIVDHGHAPQ